MTVKPCAEGNDLAAVGADTSGCMTIAAYEQAIGQRLIVPKTIKPTRAQCACHLSCDIGAYNTCGHLYRYCYANYDAQTVLHNLRAHDPASPMLLGGVLPSDEVSDARQESWIDRQICIFDL